MSRLLTDRLQFLTRNRILWATFLTTLALTVMFGVVMQIWQFEIIDEMYVADQILAHIDAMTPEQREVHAWLTATIDVAYPLAYGGFFIGVALKAFPRAGLLLALPSMLVIPTDLIEGFAQVMLLSGDASYIDIKVAATPIKLMLFVVGLVITLAGLVSLYLERRKAAAPGDVA